jgi:hypothetical protein
MHVHFRVLVSKSRRRQLTKLTGALEEPPNPEGPWSQRRPRSTATTNSTYSCTTNAQPQGAPDNVEIRIL